MKINAIPLYLVCLCWLSLPLKGQRSLEAGIFTGASAYLGDLAPDFPPPNAFAPVYGLVGSFGYNRRLYLRAQVFHGRLEGSDAFTHNASRAWSFEAALSAFCMQLAYHPLGKGRKTIAGVYRTGQWSPYAFAGPGVSWVYEHRTRGLPDGRVGDRLIRHLSVGAGVRLDALVRWSVHVELGWRMCFSDELDGVHQWGRADTNDGYMLGGIGFTYLLRAEKDTKY